MRRGIGVSAVQKRKAAAEKFKSAGKELEQTQITHIRGCLETFKTNLEAFAIKYKKDIRSNPQFRAHFTKMCNRIGVDPLASNKGFWAELLGVGEFYYELSIQIIDVCLSTRMQNGGLISLNELMRRLQKKRGSSAQPISIDDVRRAIDKVKILGQGFGMVFVNNQPMILSVPAEFNTDHTDLLANAQAMSGHGTKSDFCQRLQWPIHRLEKVLNLLLELGIVWIDEHNPEHPNYWFLSLAKDTTTKYLQEQ